MVNQFPINGQELHTFCRAYAKKQSVERIICPDFRANIRKYMFCINC